MRACLDATVVEGTRWGVAPSVAVGLGTPTRASLSYFHLGQDNLPEYGIPWVPANTNPDLAQYSNGRRRSIRATSTA